MSSADSGKRLTEKVSAEIDEEIHLCPYNPQWITLFSAEHDRLRCLFPPGTPIEHIGSTSVPGLLAKPIIDIMVGVGEEATPSQRQQLVSAGYEDLGESGVPGRLYFRRRGVHSFNVHVVRFDGPIWKTNLALRNYLRADSKARDHYAAAKRGALEAGCTTLLRYSDHKSSTVKLLIASALQHPSA